MADVRFTNSHGSRVFVAYMRLDHDCGFCGDPWDVRGWVVLDPGETETRPNDTGNRWFYYYAEGEDGSVWAGPFPAEVRQARFDKCACLGVLQGGVNPYHEVGMRQLDLDRFGGVTFT
ncbi:Protein of unknown function [Geodermatophilus saharensis]|uniref:DUF1036 domain-containing protein n=1 Tax=Geodermatophilus saharensis TaxID=1137994 RepID=A0A239CNQ2_9ACTN|nr:DUF1036 domain-containing protein [Geodermatophilus saharensis]SNS21785.1 Protein of unknown function [Geodermatophilus saharensis]